MVIRCVQEVASQLYFRICHAYGLLDCDSPCHRPFQARLCHVGECNDRQPARLALWVFSLTGDPNLRPMFDDGGCFVLPSRNCRLHTLASLTSFRTSSDFSTTAHGWPLFLEFEQVKYCCPWPWSSHTLGAS